MFGLHEIKNKTVLDAEKGKTSKAKTRDGGAGRAISPGLISVKWCFTASRQCGERARARHGSNVISFHRQLHCILFANK